MQVLPKRSHEGAPPTSRFNWTHPVTLLILGSLVSALVGVVGWAFKYYIIDQDRSDLRFETQNILQAVALASGEPSVIDSEPVLCNRAKLTLLLAHNGDGKRALAVNSIAFHAKRLEPDVQQRIVGGCHIDTVAWTPCEGREKGIAVQDIYFLNVGVNGPSDGCVRSAREGETLNISPDDILRGGDRQWTITLKPDERPMTFTVFVNLLNPGLYRVWFSADYDAGRQKKKKTKPFIVEK